MVKIQDLKEIISLVDQSTIRELELTEEGSKITIKNGGINSSHPYEKFMPAEDKRVPASVQSNPQVEKKSGILHNSTSVEIHNEPSEERISLTDDTSLHQIVSPMVGTFYSKPEPGAQSFVKVGDRVKSETVVCILEAMKLFNEIEAEVSGEVIKVLANDGQLVEFGQPLFLLRSE